MRLRSKFFLITAGATLVPILATTLLGRVLVQRASKQRFEKVLADGEVEVRQKLELWSVRLGRALRRLADAEDNFTGPVLLALAAEQGSDLADPAGGAGNAAGGAPEELFRRLPGLTSRVMRERGLDILSVVDTKKRVLAAGHYPGRAGGLGAIPRAKELAQRPHLAMVRVIDRGQPSDKVALIAWRQARSPLGARLWVQGGLLIEQRFAAALVFQAPTTVFVYDQQGRQIVGPVVQHGALSRYPRRDIVLRDGNGRPIVRVQLAVSDGQLQATLQIINYVAVGLGAAALLLALFAGLLARQLTRPLEQLASAAEAVAGGDLDHRIDGASGGEVGELVSSFNRMVERLDRSQAQLVAAERIAAWQDIARRIAHEIKNPLSPIQTSIENLRKAYQQKHRALDEIFEESTTTILEEVARLKHIVSEFSSFARMPKPRPQRFKVADWISGVAALYGASGVAMQLEIADDLEVVADRELLTQVVINLLKNAQDAVAEVSEKRIGLRVWANDSELFVEVWDNGCGFSQELATQLFRPYFSTKGARGTGLGLAVCHRIAMDHGGQIEAEGATGAGARFVMTLPMGRVDSSQVGGVS